MEQVIDKEARGAMSNQYPTKLLQELNARHHFHGFMNNKLLADVGVRVIVRADGHYVWDSEGQKILDGMAGLWTTNVGYGCREIADAAHAQMLELPFYSTFFRTSHPSVILLAERIAKLAPEGLNQVFFASSGSEANDAAIKMIRHYWTLRGEPKRHIIISRRHAYHGSTIAAGSMGGMSHVHSHTYPVYDGFRHIMDPYWYGESNLGETPEAFGLRAARALEDEILAVGPENVAAFAAEPVQGAGGVKIAPSTYWPEIQSIVDKYGILLLADEVITAFGRLGHWFGSEYYGIRPHLITIAKASTSGYLPLSGVIMHDEIVKTFWDANDDFNHGHTFSGHPVACAVALKNIEIIERDGLIQHVSNVAAPALARLMRRIEDHPLVGEARSVGLLGAFEIVADKRTKQRFAGAGRVGLMCREHFFKTGFIMRALGDTMVMCPPLTWQPEQFDEAERLARRALDLTLADVRQEIAA